jgi:hypothetical protein
MNYLFQCFSELKRKILTFTSDKGLRFFRVFNIFFKISLYFFIDSSGILISHNNSFNYSVKLFRMIVFSKNKQYFIENNFTSSSIRLD